MKPGNPFVFPGPEWRPVRLDSGHQGMTLRDYFAAMAMSEHIRDCECDNSKRGWMVVIAKRAYEQADAMLREREIKRTK